MNARELFQYALDHELVTLEVERTPEHFDLDVDLDKGVDAQGYTVDGGISADLVRRYQAGELANFNAFVRREKRCDCCGHRDYDLLAAMGFTADADKILMDEEILEGLADEAEAELADIVESHQHAAIA